MIILKYYQGMSPAEIGQALRLSRSAVHHRLQKALEKLRIDYDEGGMHDD